MTIPDKSHWAHLYKRRVMIGQHLPDYDQLPERDWHKLPGILEKLDPRGLVKALKKAHAQVFYFYAKCYCGNAY